MGQNGSAVFDTTGLTLHAFRRFEFSASRQLAGRWDGNNFSGWLGVTGALDARTGLFINMADLKLLLADVLERYDHRLLNAQLPAMPTTLNVARAMRDDVAAQLPAHVTLSSLELSEEDGDAALLTRQHDYVIARGDFSAAHRTHAPKLSARENHQLYGVCNNLNGHGHNYRAEVYLPPDAAFDAQLWRAFDHVNLSTDVPDLYGRNVVTEAIADVIARRTPQADRVRVYEMPDFWAEVRAADDRVRLGRRYRFHAAHRLHSAALSADENAAVYGKCNRIDPHGHTYHVLVTVAAPIDPRTETAFDLGCLDQIAAGIIGPLDHANLDRDVAAFAARPSTGENIAAHLWTQFKARLPHELDRVDLWETPNNRFGVTG